MRAAADPRRVAGRARVGSRPLGSLADRRRPATGGARAPDHALGARSPRPPGEPRRARARRHHRRDPGSRRRRHRPGGPTGRPTASCTSPPARLVTVHLPAPEQADLEAAIVTVATRAGLARRRRLPRSGRPGARPRPDVLVPGLRRTSPRPGGCPCGCMRACATTRLDTAIARGLRSGAPLGEDPDGRARIGWQKCFADGSMGSRTASAPRGHRAGRRPAAATRAPSRGVGHAARRARGDPPRGPRRPASRPRSTPSGTRRSGRPSTSSARPPATSR